MDNTLIEYIINIIVIVPIIVCLIVISMKLSRKSIEELHIGGYSKVIEKINMTKDTALYVIRTGETGYVLVSSSNHTEIIKELSKEEIKEIIENKKDRKSLINLSKISEINLSKISEINFKKILKNNFKGNRKNEYDK